MESQKLVPISRRAEQGYSFIELLVVASLIIVMIAVAVFTLGHSRRSYRSDDAASQVVNFLREAYGRALSQRQTMSVRIDRANQTIALIDENRIVAGDEFEVRRAPLIDQVSLSQPAVGGVSVGVPPAPYSYASAVYSSNVWEAHFRSDGSVVDAAGNPMNATLFFSPTNLSDNDANLIRAVTLFGPSGSIRVWRFSGQSFTAGAS
jgi:Tfp pilus assembly protein FimT